MPEGRHVWPKMTIDENLTVGGIRCQGMKSSLKRKMYELFPRLLERKYQKAGSLSGGEQQACHSPHHDGKTEIYLI